MELFLSIFLLDLMLATALGKLERAKRKKILAKWTRGELTMKELLWLKRQPWFRNAFEVVKVDPAKKDN